MKYSPRFYTEELDAAFNRLQLERERKTKAYHDVDFNEVELQENRVNDAMRVIVAIMTDIADAGYTLTVTADDTAPDDQTPDDQTPEAPALDDLHTYDDQTPDDQTPDDQTLNHCPRCNCPYSFECEGIGECCADCGYNHTTAALSVTAPDDTDDTDDTAPDAARHVAAERYADAYADTMDTDAYADAYADALRDAPTPPDTLPPVATDTDADATE